MGSECMPPLSTSKLHNNIIVSYSKLDKITLKIRLIDFALLEDNNIIIIASCFLWKLGPLICDLKIFYKITVAYVPAIAS